MPGARCQREAGRPRPDRAEGHRRQALRQGTRRAGPLQAARLLAGLQVHQPDDQEDRTQADVLRAPGRDHRLRRHLQSDDEAGWKNADAAPGGARGRSGDRPGQQRAGAARGRRFRRCQPAAQRGLHDHGGRADAARPRLPRHPDAPAHRPGSAGADRPARRRRLHDRLRPARDARLRAARGGLPAEAFRAGPLRRGAGACAPPAGSGRAGVGQARGAQPQAHARAGEGWRRDAGAARRRHRLHRVPGRQRRFPRPRPRAPETAAHLRAGDPARPRALRARAPLLHHQPGRRKPARRHGDGPARDVDVRQPAAAQRDRLGRHGSRQGAGAGAAGHPGADATHRRRRPGAGRRRPPPRLPQRARQRGAGRVRHRAAGVQGLLRRRAAEPQPAQPADAARRQGARRAALGRLPGQRAGLGRECRRRLQQPPVARLGRGAHQAIHRRAGRCVPLHPRPDGAGHQPGPERRGNRRADQAAQGVAGRVRRARLLRRAEVQRARGLPVLPRLLRRSPQPPRPAAARGGGQALREAGGRARQDRRRRASRVRRRRPPLGRRAAAPRGAGRCRQRTGAGAAREDVRAARVASRIGATAQLLPVRRAGAARRRRTAGRWPGRARRSAAVRAHRALLRALGRVAGPGQGRGREPEDQPRAHRPRRELRADGRELGAALPKEPRRQGRQRHADAAQGRLPAAAERPDRPAGRRPAPTAAAGCPSPSAAGGRPAAWAAARPSGWPASRRRPSRRAAAAAALPARRARASRSAGPAAVSMPGGDRRAPARRHRRAAVPVRPPTARGSGSARTSR
ncbi:unnamed protein product [Rotaria sp. Silwood1]|nr:unnamed protein product [Rotaria sp. Silwood1]